MNDFTLTSGWKVVLLMSCLLSVNPVLAKFQDSNDDGVAESWPSPQFTFYTDFTSSLWTEAFQEATYRWNDTATDFEIDIVEGFSTGLCTFEGSNTASFRDDVCGDEFGTGVLAVNRYFYYPDFNQIFKSEIYFNRAVTFNVYDGNREAFADDFRRVAIHELGHAMGLDHFAATDSIMYFSLNDTFIPKIEEVNALRAVYSVKTYELTINIEGQGRVAILPKVLGTGVVHNNIFYTSGYSNFLDCNEGSCVIAIQEGLRLSLNAISTNGESFLSWDGTQVESAGVLLSPLTRDRTLTANFSGSRPGKDTDSDGVGDNADTDDDNDGVLDVNDAFPLDSSESVDTDTDGVGNNADTDDDNDGVEDTYDAFPLDATETIDSDGDGVGDVSDTDDDNDGVADIDDAFPLDGSESVDTDSDGTGNNADTDDDNDGVADIDDAFPLDGSESVDNDSDGIGDNADTDDDNDGVADIDDAFPLDPTVQKIGPRLPMWLLKAAKDKQAEQQAN